MSEDASRVYLASKADLDEAGPGSAGAYNLYLYEAGEGGGFTFIGALSEGDATQPPGVPGPAHREPLLHTARVSPDGNSLLFSAHSAALAAQVGYDNTDKASGEADMEVYRYRVGAGLACISCNPSGARPAGRAVAIQGSIVTWQAARVPGVMNEFVRMLCAMLACS